MEKIINPILEEEIIFHTTSKQSNGELTRVEVTIGPRGGNPLHVHKRFSESFKVLEGELSIQLGKQKIKLRPGNTAFAPVNVHHRFYNTSGKPVRFMVELRPASEGFENVLRIACGLANDGKAGKNGMPKSIIHMAILMNMGEGYLVGIFSFLEKLLKRLGNTPKAKQIEQELLEKYCQQKIESYVH